jgi:DNA topoisomerase-2
LVADDEKNPKKGQILKSFQDDCGNNTIKFTLTFLNGALQELVKKKEIESKLKLINKHSMSNMHLYDANGIIKKYNTINEIHEDYHKYRYSMYQKRKEHYLKVLENQLTIIGWKIKFLDDVINGTIIVIDFENKKARTKANVIQQLKYYNYPVLSNNPFASEDDKSHDYLLSIKIFDLTDEERAKTKEEYNKKFNEHDIYKNTTVENIWLNELDELEIAYRKWIINNEDIDDKPEKKKGKGKAPRKRAVKMDI